MNIPLTNLEIFQIHGDFQQVPNERAVEFTLLRTALGSFSANDVIEVGAVSPMITKDIHHTIIDPYDDYEHCVRIDAEEYDFSGKNVVCISTIEHMGKQDYSPDTEIDPEKPIRFLNKLIDESASFIVTYPIGSNSDLDTYVFDNWDNLPCNAIGLVRISPFHIWIPTTHLEMLRKIKYNDPYPNGNGIIILGK